MTELMNFDDAMASHIVWKLRLTRLIDGTDDGHVDRCTIGDNEACDLGRWILRERAKYQGVAAYDRLLAEHAEFHRQAAEVIRKVDNGDRADARALVDGPFEDASRRVINAIAELRQQFPPAEIRVRKRA
jgi:hypothetical protein